MDRRRYRLLYLGFALALAALAALVIVLYPEGEESSIPAPLEGLSPRPGDAVVRQTAIEVDLPVGYDLDLYVDGQRIPDAEIGFTEPTGSWIWQPGLGKTVEQWSGGDHTVVITWDRVEGGRPDPGEFEWTFRVQ